MPLGLSLGIFGAFEGFTVGAFRNSGSGPGLHGNRDL